MSHPARPARPVPTRVTLRAAIGLVVALMAVDAAADDTVLVAARGPGDGSLQAAPPTSHTEPAKGRSSQPASRVYIPLPGFNTPAADSSLEPDEASLPLPPVVPAAAAVGAEPPAGFGDDGIVIVFGSEDADVPAADVGSLDAVVRRLQESPKALVALRGFAAPLAGESPLRARRLALWRARAVRAHLLAAGIAEKRVVLQAFGEPDGNPLTERVDVAVVAP